MNSVFSRSWYLGTGNPFTSVLAMPILVSTLWDLDVLDPCSIAEMQVPALQVAHQFVFGLQGIHAAIPVKFSLLDLEDKHALVSFTDLKRAIPYTRWRSDGDVLLFPDVLEGHVGVHLEESLV